MLNRQRTWQFHCFSVEQTKTKQKKRNTMNGKKINQKHIDLMPKAILLPLLLNGTLEFGRRVLPGEGHVDSPRRNFNATPVETIGTLSNRLRRPDDGNRKRDISFETSLCMYNRLWPDVTLKWRTWERGVSCRDEDLSTRSLLLIPFSVLLCYLCVEPR